jgi:succinate dehydrogenase/fumarate reductase flavoprotein subunit
LKTLKPYDVIVIGSGGGGLRAAIGAAEKGAKTLVVGRGKLTRSGATLLAGANISADIACDGGSLHKMGLSSLNKNDTPEKFAADILHEGFYLGNQELIELYAATAPQRIAEMIAWGMQVRGTEGERGIAVFGSDILDALNRRLNELKVEALEDTQFVDLLSEGGAVQGVIVLDLLKGELLHIPARAVVLATGGAHGLFDLNTGGTDLMGEGQGCALRHGAPLVDMEMISFCPTVMTYPEMFKGNLLPYIFASLGYARLLNKTGSPFTSKYLSREVENLALNTEWNKMLLSFAIQSEINAGLGTLHGGVFCDLVRQPLDVMDELYHALPGLKTGIYKDIMQLFDGGRALSVAPAAHYFEGGIAIDRRMAAGLAGLFAAGECTGGLFGANRVTAATTEMLVEGAVAGASAAAYARDTSSPAVPASLIDGLDAELRAPFSRSSGINPREIIRRLKAATSKSLYVLRNAEELSAALGEVNGLQAGLPDVSFTQQSPVYNREWMEYLGLHSSLVTARAILTAALARTESRGVHIRSDHFHTDNDAHLCNYRILDAGMRVEKTPVQNNALVDPGVRGYAEYIETVVARLS